MTSDRATTLQAAFQVCDLGALTGAEIDSYYVDLSTVRSARSITSVSKRLSFLKPGQPAAILFTGHRGCGKSTELQRIKRRWELEYEVIYIKATDELDINDADYKDIYLVIVKYLTQALQSWGLNSDPALVSVFEDWFKDITQETERTKETSVSVEGKTGVGGGIASVLAMSVNLLAQIKGSEKHKRLIRESLQQGFSRLQDHTNALLKDAFSKLQTKKPNTKGFLFIFDNLDRVPPQVGEHLFLRYANQLAELHCAVIYTVPISVIYSGNNYANVFDKLNVMPMVNIYQFERGQPELGYSTDGLNAMAALVDRRVDSDRIFESRDVLLELAQLSGGHVRQLMQLLRAACLTAEGNRISSADITLVAADEQNHFERFIPSDHYPVLVEIYQNKGVLLEPAAQAMMQSMLFNITVLEYSQLDNQQAWKYINPLVRRTNAFQEALRA
ncbi:AAA family ATPase [Nodosilinea sp. PGN35]|uniref:AAA family ATPase n=1 Tax=Nodosilinea sp. PGN35 TaxID=3020489 RepID=UPI0023B22F88|nr:AAA family ATPase [Nodosilinea sp. TSF1-S3]MDF0365639.1 AAA family ATPase [Nodosilinea sp. TSF1-S3]